MEIRYVRFLPETDQCRRSLTGIFMSRSLNNILSTGAISLREALCRDGTELNGNEEILSRYFHRKDPGLE